FGKIRPWIILVEATLPNSQEESYYDWEPLLLNAGYEYAYFDGLNRYYVSGEHENLKAAFKAPPNVFDDFVISKQIESERRAEARAQKAEARAAQAEAALQAVFSSRSWRVTAPLRRLAAIVRPPREKAVVAIGASFNETSSWSAPAPSMTAAPELMELSPRAR